MKLPLASESSVLSLMSMDM